MALPRLKIKAEDTEDLHILSAHLQDALVPLHSLHFDPEQQTFSGLCHRFCWEHDGHFFQNKALYHRVHAGLTFRHVRSVHHKGFHRSLEKHPLNLLTIQSNEKGRYAHVHLIFSGQSEIRLEVASLLCHLGDLHHPWPTHNQPSHEGEINN